MYAAELYGWIRVKEGDAKVDIAPTVNELKPHFQKLLADESFIKSLAFRNPKTPISPESIHQVLGVDVSSEIVERVLSLLNNNIDPKSLPRVLNREFNGIAFPPELATLMAENSQVRNSFLSLVTDKKLMSTLRGRFNSPEVVEQLGKIDNFIHLFQSELMSLPGMTPEQVAVITNSFKGMVKLSDQDKLAPYADGVSKSLSSISASMMVGSVNQYFEVKYPDKQYEGWVSPAVGITTESIGERLQKHAEALEIATYGVNLYRKVSQIYQQAFPEIYSNPGDIKLKIVEEGTDWSHISENNGIIIGMGKEFLETRSLDSSVETAVGFATGTRRVVHSTFMAHELTHAIYEHRTNKEQYVRLFNNTSEYYDTIDSSVNEGFAVLMESIFADYLISHPQILNLTETDITRLQENKMRRFHELRRQKSSYTEGVYRILHKVYKTGAGQSSARSEEQMRSGLQRVAEFVDGIDLKKTIKGKRTNKKYIKLLEEGNPEAWVRYLHKKSEHNQEANSDTDSLQGVSPSMAIGDAMMLAGYKDMDDVLEMYEQNTDIPYPKVISGWEKHLKRNTADKCKDSSIYAIDYLNGKHGGLFSHLLLLEAHRNEAVPFKSNSDYDFHTYFLARDKEGIWYAGSPANHTIGGRNSPLTTVFSSESLDEILSLIRQKDGGDWPSAQYVERVLQESYTPPSPVNTSRIKLFTISKEDGAEQEMTEDYKVVNGKD